MHKQAGAHLRAVNASEAPAVIEGSPIGVCTQDPDRWTTAADKGAKALCRTCPLRWRCAQEACLTPGAEGVWAGILIPEGGRARRFALKQLRSLAEQNGYPVRKTG
ncbi:WhiB family transcriptional regulator [Mycolicibacterium moriokaense]|jgi:WhiB family redox-sensing transcriptional regulator|uniref:WhiB family transcriptional regulator n=1 Tax=Mycolicibacterium moriokaense TaxID=39691 RepID=A0AAD1H9H9_9MYCO|nr:WhiB family transcriptional regulator [Mycolicibacterium moriokaense]MCV7041879.1 WhiB family transcriptional regulator [Mycolicibacterium moriokaense]BBX01333.1 WhiB family transcriptional regulator [Mycolicibacterium moriokaense]